MANTQADPPRPSARTAWSHWYWTQRWRKKAKAQLRASPLCAMCEGDGRVAAATIADHVIPHRGDEALFWNGDLQSLCKSCHDSAKQREERSPVAVLDDDGWPLDPLHLANRSAPRD